MRKGKEKVCVVLNQAAMRGERTGCKCRVQKQADDGYNMAVLPRGQVYCAYVADLVLLSRMILVQIPHDEQLDREQNSHCVQIVDRVGRAGIARLDEQERPP